MWFLDFVFMNKTNHSQLNNYQIGVKELTYMLWNCKEGDKKVDLESKIN